MRAGRCVCEVAEYVVITAKSLPVVIRFVLFDEIDERANAGVPNLLDAFAVLLAVKRTGIGARWKPSFDDPVTADGRRRDRRQ